MTTALPLRDSYGRVLRDLRVSVTDRCNFRCLYCLPETEEAANFYRTRAPLRPAQSPPSESVILREWKPRHELLTFEEIERAVRLFATLGIQKLRLTGGEPLLRNDLPNLVRRLAPIPGISDLALTSNGFLFPRLGRPLREAGLQRISFSLDSLDREQFRKMTGRDGLPSVLTSLDLAAQLGFAPLKVNAVVIRGLNDQEIPRLAEFARERRLSLRFIEFMPLDSGRAWLRELVVPGREILERLREHHTLTPVTPTNPSETARRWTFPDGRGEIGIIAPVSEPFCGHCNRIRLTADGQIRTCLFSLHEHDLRARLRGGESDEDILRWIREITLGKEERHHIGEAEFEQPQRSMSCIGG
ncbi:MAG: GTP 3',8-cyclase MoaA [Verrucomicrobiales bacterium]|nr:GTP 3',8-cyclase MoaA [Verrucomicrobiales bacterium]